MELSMSYGPVTVWLFGKLPAHGDFVSRGLDPVVRDCFDVWMSDEIAQARARFGDEFEARYDSAPAVRFALPTEDGHWDGGALCASMDSAGRRFPILIARSVREPVEACASARLCEDIIYAAFGEGWNADTVVQNAATAPFAGSDEQAPSTWWIVADNAIIPVKATGHRPVGLMEQLLEMVG
jgi:type VI secretion system protein ImpM